MKTDLITDAHREWLIANLSLTFEDIETFSDNEKNRLYSKLVSLEHDALKGKRDDAEIINEIEDIIFETTPTLSNKYRIISSLIMYLGLFLSLACGIFVMSNISGDAGVVILIGGIVLSVALSIIVQFSGHKKAMDSATQNIDEDIVEKDTVLDMLSDAEVPNDEPIEFSCPVCNETVTVSKGEFYGMALCPMCGTEIDLDKFFNE